MMWLAKNNSLSFWRKALMRISLLAGFFLLSACSPEKGRQDGAAAISTPIGTGTLLDGRLSYSSEDYYQKGDGKAGGVLRATTALDTGTFDIHSIAHGNVQWLGRLVFDGLVYQDEQGNISPWLAKSWEISEDGKTYTFHLRDDVTFSDGAPFDADAVQVNLEHMRDPATKSPLAAAYIRPYVRGRIVDKYTFEATLSEPYTPFLDVLAQSWLSMISPKQIREDPKSIAERPIGSGPFTLKSYVRNQGAVFVKRADYNWSPPVIRHQGAAYLDRIELSFVPEAMIRYSSLQSSQSDFTLDAPPQNAQAIRGDPVLRLHSRIRKGNPFRNLTFNVERAPFDDVLVRRALALAIDREGVAAITGFGEYLVKNDFLAANTRYYDPAFKDALAHNVEEANRLLDQAGWAERDADKYRLKNGRRLGAALTITENPAFPNSVAVALQSDARKVGFDLQIEVVPQPVATARRYAGDYQAVGGGYWHTNTPDGLYILYHSNSIPSNKLIGQNASRLRDAELDDALARARRSSDPAELQTLYSKAQRRLTELVPAVPAYESHHMVAYRQEVKGIFFDTSHNTPIFIGAWLDKEGP